MAIRFVSLCFVCRESRILGCRCHITILYFYCYLDLYTCTIKSITYPHCFRFYPFTLKHILFLRRVLANSQIQKFGDFEHNCAIDWADCFARVFNFRTVTADMTHMDIPTEMLAQISVK